MEGGKGSGRDGGTEERKREREGRVREDVRGGRKKG